MGIFMTQCLQTAKMAFGQLHMACPFASKLSSVSLYERRCASYRQSKFWMSDNRGFSWQISKNGQNGLWGITYALGSKSSTILQLHMLHMGPKLRYVSLYNWRFPRYRQSTFQTSDNSGFSSKWVYGNCICPLDRNRAPFCSMIDSFRDIGNQSFRRMTIRDFHDKHLKRAKSGFWANAYALWV